jgi:hypothetical protein
MPKKPKTPSSHLAFWKAVAKRNPFQMSLDWSNETVWITHARVALNLDSGFSEKWNGPVRKAFKDFRLDPNNPYDCRLLLTLYVHSHPSRGRPAKWNSESLCSLLRHISRAREKRLNAAPSEIYRSLIRPKAAYSGKTESYLKHGHRLALNLDRNDTLRNARDLVASGYLDVLRVGYQEEGRAITASDESRVRYAVLGEALELIGAPLGRWGNN